MVVSTYSSNHGLSEPNDVNTHQSEQEVGEDCDPNNQKHIVTISETFQRYQKSGSRTIRSRNGKTSKISRKAGDLVKRKTKLLMDFHIVGLSANDIHDVAKQIQNQASRWMQCKNRKSLY